MSGNTLTLDVPVRQYITAALAVGRGVQSIKEWEPPRPSSDLVHRLTQEYRTRPWSSLRSDEYVHGRLEGAVEEFRYLAECLRELVYSEARVFCQAVAPSGTEQGTYWAEVYRCDLLAAGIDLLAKVTDRLDDMELRRQWALDDEDTEEDNELHSSSN